MSAPKSIIVLLLTTLLGAGVAGAQGRFGQGQGRDRQQGPSRDSQGQNRSWQQSQNRDRQQGPSRDWQNQNRWQQNQGRDRQQAQQQGGWQRSGPGGGHAGDWLRQHKGQSLEEQQRALQNDPGFRNLPPDRQQRYLDRLRDFNSRPPDQQQQILRRMERWDQMSPVQRQQARDLFQQFRGLPEDRRRMLAPALRNLRDMNPQDRQRALDSSEYRNNFNDRERDILRGMSDLDVGVPRPPDRDRPAGNEVPRPPR